MSCSFCTEFCPFDAIKMNHDYELAVYDRYPQLVYDKEELTVPLEYYAALWPVQFAAEQQNRAKEEAEAERIREEEKKRAAEEKAKGPRPRVRRRRPRQKAAPSPSAPPKNWQP
jgi:NADH-quinone oxidoreductase subunit I